MRVVSGKFKGIRLTEPDDLAVRPTQDRVKTSLFDTLNYMVRNATVLDLFCGSGALGIEALSRGAKACFFCDLSKKSIDLAKLNLSKCDKKNECLVTFINASFENAILRLKQQNILFDIILVDPPYDLKTALDAVKMAFSNNLLTENGLIAFETDKKEYEEDIKELHKNYRVLKYGAKQIFLIYN